MTPQQAKSIYALSAEPAWQHLNDYWQSELDKILESAELWRVEDLEKIQGEIIRIKENLKLRETAKSVLESEK